MARLNYLKAMDYEKCDSFPYIEINGNGSCACKYHPCDNTLYEYWQPEHIQDNEFNLIIKLKNKYVYVRSCHFEFIEQTQEDKKMNTYYQYFSTHELPNGKFRVLLTEDCLSKLWSFMSDIHRDIFYESFPSDWVFEVTLDCFKNLSKCDCVYEVELCEMEDEAIPDTYTLLTWLTENSHYALQKCEEHLEIMGCQNTFLDIIKGAYYTCKEEIFNRCKEFVMDNQ